MSILGAYCRARRCLPPPNNFAASSSLRFTLILLNAAIQLRWTNSPAERLFGGELQKGRVFRDSRLLTRPEAPAILALTHWER